MKQVRYRLFAAVLFCMMGLSGLTYAVESQLFNQWKADPLNSPLYDFSRAGYGYGTQEIPEIPEGLLQEFHVDSFGAVANDTISDLFGIQSAIDAAAMAGGGIVKLGPGRYIIGGLAATADFWPIMVRSNNIIIRGSGSQEGGTLIYNKARTGFFSDAWTSRYAIYFAHPSIKGKEFTYGKWQANPDSTSWYYTSALKRYEYDTIYTTAGQIDTTYSKKADGFVYVKGLGVKTNVLWSYVNEFVLENTPDYLCRGTSDAKRHTHSITVERPELFSPGMVVHMVLAKDEQFEEFVLPWDHTKFADASKVLRRPVRQILTVASVSGNTISFVEPFKADFKTRYDIVLARYRALSNVGIEDLTFQGATGLNQYKQPEPVSLGVSFTNVYNGWAKNVRFINSATAVILAQCKNVSVSNCTYERQGVDNVSTGFAGFHDSFKFLGTTNDCYMEKLSYLSNPNWGPSMQESSSGNVYYGIQLWNIIGWKSTNPKAKPPSTGNCDMHGGTPYCNLYDSLSGGFMGPVGGGKGETNGGPRNVWWNWTAHYDTAYAGELRNASNTLQFPVFADYPTGLANICNLIQPIIVGYRATGPAQVSVEYAPLKPTTPFISDTVIAEALNEPLTPGSLFYAQLQHRFGGGKEKGIFVVIDGPQYGFVGQHYSFSAARTVGPSSLSYEWYVNGTKKGSGSQFSLSIDSVCKTVIKVVARSPRGSEMFGEKEFYTADPAQIIVYDNNSYLEPRSFGTAHGKRKWHAEAAQDKRNTKSAYLGMGILKGNTETSSNFGIAVSDWSAEKGNFGGILYTELPQQGIAIAQTKLQATLGPLDLYPSKDLNIFAIAIRDKQGNWAMSSGKLNKGALVMDFATTEWVPMDSSFNKPRGPIDKNSITAIGVCVMRKNVERGGSDGYPMMVYFKDFLLTAQGYAIPINRPAALSAYTAPSLQIRGRSIAVVIGNNAPFTVEAYLLNGKRAALVRGKEAGVVDLSSRVHSAGMHIIRVRQSGMLHTFTHCGL